MMFKDAKVGDYIFRPKPGISYKRSLMVVLFKGKNSIALLKAGTTPTPFRTITDGQFKKANFEPVTGEMIASEFNA